MASVGDREIPARQWTNARLLDSRTLSITLHNTPQCTAAVVAMLYYIVTLCLPDHLDTLLTSCSVYWTLQRVSSLAHRSSTTACHTCCMRNCTGSTSQNVSTTNWKSQCIAVCSTRLQSTWSTVVHQSQTFPADVIYGQPLDITWPYHVTSSALSVVGPSLSLVRRSGTCRESKVLISKCG